MAGLHFEGFSFATPSKLFPLKLLMISDTTCVWILDRNIMEHLHHFDLFFMADRKPFRTRYKQSTNKCVIVFPYIEIQYHYCTIIKRFSKAEIYQAKICFYLANAPLYNIPNHISKSLLKHP